MARGNGGTHHGAIPYGKRAERKTALAKAAESAPEQFKALTLPFLPELVEIMKADARDRTCIGHRTAVGAILDGLKITGATDRLVDALLASLNLRDEAHLALAAQMFHSASGATIQDARRNAVAVIREIVRSNPDETGRLMQECFGLRAADAESLLGVRTEVRDGSA